jgi:hypothetical protein
LVKVDQDQEIPQKYPGAFDEEEDAPHVIEVEGSNEKSVVECDPDTAKAVGVMEKFLQFEDITIKSILGCKVLVDKIKGEDNNTFEITENTNLGPFKKKDQPPDTFTSHPFSGQTPSNQAVADHDIVPVSEDVQDRTVDSGSDTDKFVMDLDCDSSSVLSTRPDDKTSSETKSSESSNMPDLSVVSVANKFYTLYTCKVCDSKHKSLKDLKQHERKTHTKCPFCRKRFTALAIRKKHIVYFCPKKNTRHTTKKLKILLVKVDQDHEIRQKYPGAFDEEEDAPHVIEVEGPSEKGVVECDPDTAKAVRDMKKFFLFTEDVKEDTKQKKDETPSGSADDAKSDQESAKEEVIFISFEETEVAKSELEGSQRIIKVVNRECLQNFNPDDDDNDVNMLKQVLRNARLNVYESMGLNNNSIVDGGSNRVKIFKNLRKHLRQYRLPIELKYNDSVLVEYISAKAPVSKNTKDLWHSMTPRQLKKPNECAPDHSKEKASTNAQENDERLNRLKETIHREHDYASQGADCQPEASPQGQSCRPKNTTTTANLILPSGSIMTATANGNCTSNAFLILNGSTNGANFANIILVPGTLIPKKMIVSVSQESLPMLQTVSSAGCSNTQLKQQCRQQWSNDCEQCGDAGD